MPEPPESQRTQGDAAPDPIAGAIDVLRAVPRSELQARGYHFEPLHFYSGVNDLAFLDENRDLWHGRPLPKGVQWDLDAQVALLSRLAGHYHELLDVPAEPDDDGPPTYHWRNPFWTDADAFVQYGMLRECKPRRVVEIGCGWSSLLMARALAQNEASGAPRATVDQVEPFPRSEIMEALPADWTHHESILQRVPVQLFETLQAGDVCFYDGSHVARTASDVVWLFSEILPRLKAGVLVHVHDVFWPNDYPDDWIVNRGQTWNEQYMLQAFLMYNEEFELLMCNSALFAERRPEVLSIYASTAANGHGCSVWLARR